MKVSITFNVDVDILKDFSDNLKKNSEFPDDVIEELMKSYVENTDTDTVVDGGTDTNTDTDYEKLTEILLTKCRIKYRVGQFADIVLRKLLEAGVATEEEVMQMQTASGKITSNKYHISFGSYCRENFKTSFPLLITTEQKIKYDVSPPKFLVNPLIIRNEKFHLSAQWYTYNREPMENWIRSHLPKWFKRATEEQKADMTKFIYNR